MIIGSTNKGDWSEFYVLVYLLAMGRLHAADVDLYEITPFHFPIIKVLRDEKRNKKIVDHIEYQISGNSVEIYVNAVLIKRILREKFEDEYKKLRVDIPAGTGKKVTIPHGEKFLNDLFLNRLAAPAREIADIKMEVYDVYTGINQRMGFSIKSYLGGAPTLLNASKATNFIYEVTGISAGQMHYINSIDDKSGKIKKRIEQIKKCGGSFKYKKTENKIFSENLIMIDSYMENILSEMLLYSYQSGEKKCLTILDHMEKNNPVNYPRSGLYIYKFKKFLCAKALGMEPSSRWTGIDQANGGYIVVKSDGNVVAFHLYNRNVFETYLLNNTYFERGSTDKHKFAVLYEEEGHMYIKLNLQIRFFKNH